jgi:hypothetical protein
MMTLYHSTKTQIRKSVCHERFGEVQRSPVVISTDGDSGQNTLIQGMKNFVPHDSFPKEDIRIATEDVTNMVLTHCISDMDVASKRSLREAIIGIPGKVVGLTMNTSPGVPWVWSAKTKSKKDIIDIDYDVGDVTVDPRLLTLLDEEENAMAAGIAPLTIFQVTHKDERLPPNKVTKPRLIQGSPLTLTISSRKFLMDFNYAFQNSRLDLEHAVGINPESLDWDTLAKKLTEHSPYICTGDFSKFGPRLLTDFVHATYKVRNSWYNQFDCPKEHQTTRTMLGYRVADSFNMAYNRVFQVRCGSPSGDINTVQTNSICNMLYFRCAWIGIMRELKPELTGLHHFKDLVVFYCYGDDVIFSVHPSVIELFNNETISNYFKKFNVLYTDVNKDGSIRKYCSIEEATFLKKGFSKFTDTPIPGGVWICVPPLSDILDTTNWVRKTKGVSDTTFISENEVQAAVVNCEDAVRKSWFHGRSCFDKLQADIRDFWKSYGGKIKPRNFTFEGLQIDYGIPTFQGVDFQALQNDFLQNDQLLDPTWRASHCDG